MVAGFFFCHESKSILYYPIKTAKPSTCISIKTALTLDSLSYQYEGDRLISVEDAGNNIEGFENGVSQTVEYDANSLFHSCIGSNMVNDDNKGITHSGLSFQLDPY